MIRSTVDPPNPGHTLDDGTDLAKVTQEVADQLKRCAELLVTAQDSITGLLPPVVHDKQAMLGLQQLDRATQNVECLALLLEAVSKTVAPGQTLSREEIDGGPILQEVERRVWPREDYEPPKGSPGTVDLF